MTSVFTPASLRFSIFKIEAGVRVSILPVSQNCYNAEMTSCAGNTWSLRDVWVSSGCGAFVLVFGNVCVTKGETERETPAAPRSRSTPQGHSPCQSRLNPSASGCV